MKYIFVGDRWALKGFTEQNYHYANHSPMAEDVRLADHWPWNYDHCLAPGCGNISCMEMFQQKKVDPTLPVIWVFTEPGRDYSIITGRPEFEWIESENIFEIRKSLEQETFSLIRDGIKNPIGFIGGLSDVNKNVAESYGFTVLHPSWQSWIATKLESRWFKFGWGACDVGWRANYNDVMPSRTATLAWDEQIKEWCWWAEQGYFCHEHPTPLANKEFAEFLKPTVQDWLIQYG